MMRLRLQNMLGAKVYDAAGAYAGRVEEIVARRDEDGSCRVTGYLLGREGWAWRLSVPGLALSFLRGLGASKTPGEQIVPWDQMDWANPRRPRLKCTLEDLKKPPA